MARPSRLVVNADDFGRSPSINEAVRQAHREGILTTSSLMVNEASCEEAVTIARQEPRLGVGLHLALVCGKAGLPPADIPGLAGPAGAFSSGPAWAGLRYFFRPGLRPQLEREIALQFDRFHATGLRLDHVNGHLHIHLHPTVFGILIEHAREWGIRHLRLTRDPFWVNARLAGGQWLYRISHYWIYRLLAGRARAVLTRLGIRHTERVFGLLQNARVDEAYVAGLIKALPEGDSELYSHPSLDEFRHELNALVSSRVRARVKDRGIQLARYQDL